MKFLQTRVTIEKYRETISSTESTYCPNCGHQILRDRQTGEQQTRIDVTQNKNALLEGEEAEIEK